MQSRRATRTPTTEYMDLPTRDEMQRHIATLLAHHTDNNVLPNKAALAEIKRISPGISSLDTKTIINEAWDLVAKDLGSK